MTSRGLQCVIDNDKHNDLYQKYSYSEYKEYSYPLILTSNEKKSKNVPIVGFTPDNRQSKQLYKRNPKEAINGYFTNACID